MAIIALARKPCLFCFAHLDGCCGTPLAGGPDLKRNFTQSRVPPVPRSWGPGRSSTRAARRAAVTVEGPAVALAFLLRTTAVERQPLFYALFPIPCLSSPYSLVSALSTRPRLFEKSSTRRSRAEFARRFTLAPRALQDWEQGRRRPDRAARAYLTVIARHPEAVVEALAESPTPR